MMKKLIVSAAVIAFLILSTSDVFACSCIVDNENETSESKKVKAWYKEAIAVFYGEVTEVTRQEDSVKVKFMINRSWKGPALPEMMIRTAQNSAMCGFNFEVGKTYIVYAVGANADLRTNLCTRTSSSYADAKYLNKIKKPSLFSTAVRK
jgi:hypothetical protein